MPVPGGTSILICSPPPSAGDAGDPRCWTIRHLDVPQNTAGADQSTAETTATAVSTDTTTAAAVH